MDMKRFQMRYTLGRAFDDSPYHIAVIRSPLTRNLSNRFDDIRDEIVESFKDHIPATEGEVYLRQTGGLLIYAVGHRMDRCPCIFYSHAHYFSH